MNRSIAQRLQKPIVLTHARFGELVYDRRFKSYGSKVDWCGSPVNLALSCPSPDDPRAVLEVADALFSEPILWHHRVQQYALEQLLPLKNDSWLDEDESEVTPETFLSKMRLRELTIAEEGDIAFWHDDGDLFWGHTILIAGTLSDGLTDADIPG